MKHKIKDGTIKQFLKAYHRCISKVHMPKLDCLDNFVNYSSTHAICITHKAFTQLPNLVVKRQETADCSSQKPCFKISFHDTLIGVL